MTRVKTAWGTTNSCCFRVGVYQDSDLRPFLFILLMNDLLTRAESRLFADDITQVGRSHEDLETQLGCYQQALEGYGLRISWEKVHDFPVGNDRYEKSSAVASQSCKVEEFKYLVLVVQRNGDFDADDTHRFRVGWAKWRQGNGILCDKNGVLIKLKGKFYRTLVRSAFLYGSELAVKNTEGR